MVISTPLVASGAELAWNASHAGAAAKKAEDEKFDKYINENGRPPRRGADNPIAINYSCIVSYVFSWKLFSTDRP